MAKKEKKSSTKPKKIKITEIPSKIKILSEVKKDESKLEEEVESSETRQFSNFVSTGRVRAPILETGQAQERQVEAEASPQAKTGIEQTAPGIPQYGLRQTAQQTESKRDYKPPVLKQVGGFQGISRQRNFSSFQQMSEEENVSRLQHQRGEVGFENPEDKKYDSQESDALRTKRRRAGGM